MTDRVFCLACNATVRPDSPCIETPNAVHTPTRPLAPTDAPRPASNEAETRCRQYINLGYGHERCVLPTHGPYTDHRVRVGATVINWHATDSDVAEEWRARSVPPSGEAEARGDGEPTNAQLAESLRLMAETFSKFDAPGRKRLLWAASRLSSSAPGDGGEGADAKRWQAVASRRVTLDFVDNGMGQPGPHGTRYWIAETDTESFRASTAEEAIDAARAALATPSTPSTGEVER